MVCLPDVYVSVCLCCCVAMWLPLLLRGYVAVLLRGYAAVWLYPGCMAVYVHMAPIN